MSKINPSIWVGIGIFGIMLGVGVVVVFGVMVSSWEKATPSSRHNDQTEHETILEDLGPRLTLEKYCKIERPWHGIVYMTEKEVEALLGMEGSLHSYETYSYKEADTKIVEYVDMYGGYIAVEYEQCLNKDKEVIWGVRSTNSRNLRRKSK